MNTNTTCVLITDICVVENVYHTTRTEARFWRQQTEQISKRHVHMVITPILQTRHFHLVLYNKRTRRGFVLNTLQMHDGVTKARQRGRLHYLQHAKIALHHIATASNQEL